MKSKSSVITKVHEKVHGLKMKRNWSKPKIYHGGDNFDLSKDWYVYYSFRNPETGRLERQSNIKRGNRYKSKTHRLQILSVYRKALEELLEEGFSPYEVAQEIEDQNTLEYAIDYAMKNKRETWSETNYSTMKARVGVFKRYLKDKRLLNRPATAFTRSHANEFLDQVLHSTSASNRNNYRAGLSPLFTFLMLREIVKENHFVKIPKLKIKPKGKKVYSKALQKDVIAWLKNNDPALLQFIQIFTFGMIRPIEAARLKVGDINVQERFFYVNSKQKSRKKKIISQLLLDVLPDLEGVNPEFYLITKNGSFGQWNVNDRGRREFFSKRFGVMRDVLGFDPELKMYNFRHTIVTELYTRLIEQHGKRKAIEMLQEITGHSTEKALMHYIKTIDAKLPEDFSIYLD